ncbi:DUF3224 domain-containing protein [Haloechinothrix salitolerans]|uniref:DUF3224 domain-containing protein n=1 Tax=Haloechinothrix salitolerans TaxID=926830 RepID=A0ABW2C6Q8_9PSEU
MSENTFTMRSWQEDVVSGGEDEPHYTHAHATFTYSGVIEGSSTCDYLLYYPGGQTDGAGATSPGLERIEGSVDGRSGTFMIKHDVGFGEHGVTGIWQVLPGSGTSELAGLSGNGTIYGASETMAYTFDYKLAGQ